MPVPSDTHNADTDLVPGTTKSDIVAVFYNNPNNRFSADDIQNRLGISHGTVTATLTRLNKDGLVGKTEDRFYQALDHRDDLRRYIGSLNQLEMMFNDRNYDEHTNRNHSQLEDIDEDEIGAEIAELEAELKRE